MMAFGSRCYRGEDPSWATATATSSSKRFESIQDSDRAQYSSTSRRRNYYLLPKQRGVDDE